jgi:predicted glutamine amidotransferase
VELSKVCRLFGFAAHHAESLVEVLGAEDFEAFTALTVVHDDGWGIAWHEDAHEEGRARLLSTSSATSASGDAAYKRLARTPLGPAGIVHLRWASPGLPVRPENTHPFVAGERALAHNGHIAPIGRLDGLLDRHSRDALRGDTDSERYFRFVLQCIAEAGDDELGLARAVAILMEEFPHASLNALLLTTSQLFAVHVNSRAAVPAALHGLGLAAELVPARHNDDEYFAMDYRRTPSGVQVISSGIDPDGWTPIPEDTIGVLDLATLDLRWRAASEKGVPDGVTAGRGPHRPSNVHGRGGPGPPTSG